MKPDKPTSPQDKFTPPLSSREKAPQVGFPVLALQVLGIYFIFNGSYFFIIDYFLWKLLHLVSLPECKILKGWDYILVIILLNIFSQCQLF